MMRKTLSVICVAVVVCGGCWRYKRVALDQAMLMESTGLSGYGGGGMGKLAGHASFGLAGGTVEAASRHLAVRHTLEIVEPAAGLEKSVEAVVAYCGTIQCEVLSSSVSGTVPNATPSGRIVLRVAPRSEENTS